MRVHLRAGHGWTADWSVDLARGCVYGRRGARASDCVCQGLDGAGARLLAVQIHCMAHFPCLRSMGGDERRGHHFGMLRACREPKALHEDRHDLPSGVKDWSAAESSLDHGFGQSMPAGLCFHEGHMPLPEAGPPWLVRSQPGQEAE